MQGNYAILNTHLLSFEESFRYAQYNVVDVLGILNTSVSVQNTTKKSSNNTSASSGLKTSIFRDRRQHIPTSKHTVQ